MYVHVMYDTLCLAEWRVVRKEVEDMAHIYTTTEYVTCNKMHVFHTQSLLTQDACTLAPSLAHKELPFALPSPLGPLGMGS